MYIPGKNVGVLGIAALITKATSAMLMALAVHEGNMILAMFYGLLPRYIISYTYLYFLYSFLYDVLSALVHKLVDGRFSIAHLGSYLRYRYAVNETHSESSTGLF